MRSSAPLRPPAAGRPLIAALAVLSCWVAIRASTWESPFPLPSADALFAQANLGELAAGQGVPIEFEPVARPFVTLGEAEPTHFGTGRLATVASDNGGGGRPGAPGFAHPLSVSIAGRAGLSTAHQLLFASALAFAANDKALAAAHVAKPGTMASGRGQRDVSLGWLATQAESPTVGTMAHRGAEPAPKSGRWSGDAWLLLREGRGNPQVAIVNPASYGADQLGAVLRYAFAPNSRLAPNAYTRASKALVSGGEAEIAAGVSVSLARSFPLRVHGEARLTDRAHQTGRATEARPAAFVVTGLPRREVTPGIEADAYLQAGYVGGDFETGFVDGKATVEAAVRQSDAARFTIGGGAWGGAQRDASRLDAGPTASVFLSTGKATLRASVDYRVRVAGDADPGNGVALTLAATF